MPQLNTSPKQMRIAFNMNSFWAKSIRFFQINLVICCALWLMRCLLFWKLITNSIRKRRKMSKSFLELWNRKSSIRFSLLQRQLMIIIHHLKAMIRMKMMKIKCLESTMMKTMMTIKEINMSFKAMSRIKMKKIMMTMKRIMMMNRMLRESKLKATWILRTIKKVMIHLWLMSEPSMPIGCRLNWMMLSKTQCKHRLSMLRSYRF